MLFVAKDEDLGPAQEWVACHNILAAGKLHEGIDERGTMQIITVLLVLP